METLAILVNDLVEFRFSRAMYRPTTPWASTLMGKPHSSQGGTLGNEAVIVSQLTAL